MEKYKFLLGQIVKFDGSMGNGLIPKGSLAKVIRDNYTGDPSCIVAEMVKRGERTGEDPKREYINVEWVDEKLKEYTNCRIYHITRFEPVDLLGDPIK